MGVVHPKYKVAAVQAAPAFLDLEASVEKTIKLIDEAMLKPREALREKGTPFAEGGLGAAGITDDAVIEAMLKHPILINRPFVVTGRGTRL